MNEDVLYHAVGRAIAMRRDELGFTQSDIATMVGLSRASLANIETGRQKILLHYLYRIAAALELEGVDSLLPVHTPAVRDTAHPELKIGGDELNDVQLAEVTAFYAASNVKARLSKAKS